MRPEIEGGKRRAMKGRDGRRGKKGRKGDR